MTEKNSQQKKCFPIMDILPVGKENAISTADLVKITGCTSPRDLQERIALERNAGAVICSGSGSGYWRAKKQAGTFRICPLYGCKGEKYTCGNQKRKESLANCRGAIGNGGLQTWRIEECSHWM